MFKFLREKIRATVEKFSRKADKEATSLEMPLPEATQTQKETTKQDQSLAIDLGEKDEELSTPEGRDEQLDADAITPREAAFMEGETAAEGLAEPAHEEQEAVSSSDNDTVLAIPAQKKESAAKGFFGRIKEKVVMKKIDERTFEELFTDMELALLENNVAVEVIEKIKEDLKIALVDVPVRRGRLEEAILEGLKQSIDHILSTAGPELISLIRTHEKPFVIAFVGINGSGKTTTIAKIAHYLLEQKLTVVLAAADTFRAAAIDQLEHHAQKLGVKIIKHHYGSDPAAVAFDAVAHAKAKKADVVLIDTAGRLHSNMNLIDEMKKIMRVAKPHLKIFVGEAITGNDCVEQAKRFHDAIGIDGIILSKADIDERGGAFLSVGYVTKKPVLFVGVGQDYGDLRPYDKAAVMDQLGLLG